MYNMNFDIYMFTARNGDCFLLNINGKYILIDGGYADTYRDTIKDSLPTLLKSSKIDLAIATHIDQDHIEGMIELIDKNGYAAKPNLAFIEQFWYNAYNHLPKYVSARELTSEEREILQSYVLPVHKTGITNEQISGTQGMSLSYNLIRYGYSWNTITNGDAICVENIPSYRLDANTTISLLTPFAEQLSDLAIYWKKELKQKKWSFELTDDIEFNRAMEAFLCSDSNYLEVVNNEISSNASLLSAKQLAMLSAKPDNSVTNASSIAFLVESSNKKLLYLSDALEAHILKSLKTIPTRYFDAIKLSHHGSLKNANKLFDIIDGEYFFISTDGSKHNHPDFSTLAKIIIRPCKKTRKLIFNYPNSAYHYFNTVSMMKQYNYIVQLSANGEAIHI